MVTLYTARDYVPFIVDTEFVNSLSKYTWFVSSGYIAAHIPGKGHTLLHILLFGYAPEGFEWDHINEDKTDNRRLNLQHLTRSANIQKSIGGKDYRNMRLPSTNTSGVRGVYKVNRGWEAKIGVDGKCINLGLFSTIEQAIEVRRFAEEQYWGSK